MAALVPPTERIFACEYVQLHGVEDVDPSKQSQPIRSFLGEGPIVIGHFQSGQQPVIQIGMPENMTTWQMASDLPTLKVSPTAYMFAVPYSQQFYILEFLPDHPSEQLALFESCLQQFTAYAVSDDVPQASAIPDAQRVTSQDGTTFTTSTPLADNIQHYGSAVADGVHTVGEYLGKGIVQAGEWYRARYPPKQEDVKMDPKTMSRLDTAKQTTQTVAKYTTKIAGAIGTAIGQAAHTAATGLRKQGVAKEGSSTHQAARVAKAGLIAVVEVFDAMHDAGRKVVSQGATETATCVQYSYGDEAGKAAETGMGIAVDAYDVYGAYKRMRKSAMARAFAKGAVINPNNPKRTDGASTSADATAPAASAHIPTEATAAGDVAAEQQVPSPTGDAVSQDGAPPSLYPPLPPPPAPC